ncbi:MAG: hypothetical protein RIS40_815, partial [Pseudomonadota bacterium]
MENLRVFLILLLTLIAPPSKAHETLNLISLRLDLVIHALLR